MPFALASLREPRAQLELERADRAIDHRQRLLDIRELRVRVRERFLVRRDLALVVRAELLRAGRERGALAHAVAVLGLRKGAEAARRVLRLDRRQRLRQRGRRRVDALLLGGGRVLNDRLARFQSS